MKRIYLTSILYIAVFISTPILAENIPNLTALNQLCDPSIKPAKNDPRMYKIRGNRCEGLFEGDRSADVLALVSLTLKSETSTLSPRNDKEVTVQWIGPKDVWLRAVSTKPRVFYRMDTTLKASSSYSWDVSFLNSLDLPRKDVALLGACRTSLVTH